MAEPSGGAIRWLRRNLFRNPIDGAVTVVGGVVAAWVIWRLVRFVLVTGRWEIVEVNLRLFMYGRYPEVHVLRLSVAVVDLEYAFDEFSFCTREPRGLQAFIGFPLEPWPKPPPYHQLDGDGTNHPPDYNRKGPEAR